MLDLSPWISPGTGVWWSQTSAEPTPLVHALLEQADALTGAAAPVRAFCGMSWDERLTSALPDSIELSSYGALGRLRLLSRTGRLRVIPCHYSALPDLFATGVIPADVGFVQVSPPDAEGWCTLGVGVDYVADAVEHTPVLIAEINQQMPVTIGAPRVHIDRFAAVVESDRPLLTAPQRVPDDVDRTIARQVAGLIDDGDTFQIGVGTLPSAVLQCLSGHADLGVHSGMIADGVMDLVDAGVVTGARKEIDTGLVVTGAALGTTRLYERIPDLPLRFRAASYTHAPAVLAQLDRFVAVNSAIEVDLSGQVGAEMARGVHIGAVGGQADFSHAASTTGARSIIALRSTSRSESTIRAALAGPVTTTRADVDVVVTEHGAAHLRGVSLEERAERLVAVAAPEHRDALGRALHGVHPTSTRTHL